MIIIYLLYDCKVFQTSTCFIILLVLMGIGYISPIEIKKPNTVGKIGIIIVGIFETLAMMFWSCNILSERKNIDKKIK